MCVQLLQSCLPLCNLWTIAHQAPLSMGFFRQEYWSGSPCPPPGDLLDPGFKPTSLISPALAGRFFTTSNTWEAHKSTIFQFLKNHNRMVAYLMKSGMSETHTRLQSYLAPLKLS